MILPPILWRFFIDSIDRTLSYAYGQDLSEDVQVWTTIPKEDRQWVSIDELSQSLFIRQKNIIGVDFDCSTPIIADGKFWVNEIQNSIRSHSDITSRKEGRNIYVFSPNFKILIFYIYEENALLIWGKNKHLALKKVI